MSANHNEREKNVACPNVKKTHDKKWFIKNHNLWEKNTILHNFNTLIIQSAFIFVLCLKHINFIGSLPNS